MDPAEFEGMLREQLADRDRHISARAFHPAQRAEADEMFVAAVMAAAGHGGLADEGKKLRRARAARQQDENRAFAGKAG